MWKELLNYRFLSLVLLLSFCYGKTILAQEILLTQNNNYQMLGKLYEKQDALMTSLKTALKEQSEAQQVLKQNLEQALIELDSLKLELTISQDLSQKSKEQILLLEQKLTDIETALNKEISSIKYQRNISIIGNFLFIILLIVK